MKILFAFCSATERNSLSSSLLSCIAVSELLRSEFGTKHACFDFGERGIARRRHIIAERGVSAVIGGAESVHWNVRCRLQHTVTNFVRRFDAWIDWCNDPDKNMLLGLSVFANYLNHAFLVELA